MTGRLTVDKTGPFELGLTVAGRAVIVLYGHLLVEQESKAGQNYG